MCSSWHRSGETSCPDENAGMQECTGNARMQNARECKNAGCAVHFCTAAFLHFRAVGVSVERLQKILSRAGIASRRASERLMIEGRVSVNGTTVRELGSKADPERDEIRVDGRRIRLPDRHRYLLLNKPRGYVTTRSDPQERPTVIDLVGVRDYIYPVGRLDFDSEGLLVLTNDGDLAARLTHPSHGLERVYEARVLGVPDGRDLARLRKGIVLEGRPTGPAEVRLLGGSRHPGASLRPARARVDTR